MSDNKDSALDVQEGGDHYKSMGQYQPWEVLKCWLTHEEFKGYMKGTSIAYLAREGEKGGRLDIKKASHTLLGLLELSGADEIVASSAEPASIPETAYVTFDLISHIERQRNFSGKTFGPGARTEGIIDHITLELVEIRENPFDLEEWVDVILLALDGAWRAGHEPEVIARGIAAKQIKNENRKWPDWREAEEGKAIQHVVEKSATSVKDDNLVERIARQLCMANFAGMDIVDPSQGFIDKHWGDWIERARGCVYGKD